MKRLLLPLLAALLLSGCTPSGTLSASGSAGEIPLQSAPPDPLPSPAPGPEVGAETPSPPAPEASPAPLPAQYASPEEEAQAYLRQLMDGMSLEEKVGQLFLVGCPLKDAAGRAAEYHLGGYILFSSNFRSSTPAQVRAVLDACQAASDIPMLMAVDEEGGTVTRVSRFSQFRSVPFPSPRELYAQGGLEQVAADTAEKAGLLAGLGINVNMAPVCDLSGDPEDYIYQRAFSGDPEETARYVSTVVSVMEERGMGSCLKHFPGYGSNADTHTGVATDSRDYDSFLSADFLPFQAGIQAGADCVLVSHNIVTCMDPDLPASLSPEVHRVLREELGFQGVIVTDDLAMDAISQYTGDQEAAVLAILAGNDLVCCTDFAIQVPAVVDAVLDGRIPPERIDEALGRVLAWKLELGLLSLPE